MTAALAFTLIIPLIPAGPFDIPLSFTDSHFETFLDALAQAESAGNPQALGDNGQARGLFQIHQKYWTDGTALLGVNWPYSYAFDPQRSRAIVKAYLRSYGRGKSYFDLARIHNGGPRGQQKQTTIPYARKVERIFWQLMSQRNITAL